MNVLKRLVASDALWSLRPESHWGEVVCPASKGESTKEPPPNVSYHLSNVAPISHQNQVYKSFGTPKKHQKITNIGSKIATGRPRGASGAPRASQVRALLQQVGPQDTQNGAKMAPRGPTGARGASWHSFSHLWATLGRLGTLF